MSDLEGAPTTRTLPSELRATEEPKAAALMTSAGRSGEAATSAQPAPPVPALHEKRATVPRCPAPAYGAPATTTEPLPETATAAPRWSPAAPAAAVRTAACEHAREPDPLEQVKT